MQIVEKLIFEQSRPGRKGFTYPESDVPEAKKLPDNISRKEKAELPELSELDIIRHFTKLSHMNFSIDENFYPLGSCTMKYNPRVFEQIGALSGFNNIHPLLADLSSGENYTQGALEVLWHFEKLLCEITGMDDASTHPLAGAHGELVGIMLVEAYHKSKGNNKKYVIVPDSSHGTNPASAAMANYDVISIPTDEEGVMDLELFKEALNEEIAAVMLTCPNTLGLFNPHIKEIADLAHSVDALLYYDGANLNAILGKVKPGDIGFDIVHVNTHKTFATPHGGGGPGAGPIGVKKHLTQFLPNPRVIKNENNTFKFIEPNGNSIGKVTEFYGNFSIILRAYTYLLLLGKEGLIDVSEKAVLNANYIMKNLKDDFHLAYNKTCMHECVFSADKQLEKGVHAIDIAKYLIDRNIHPPTVYFPLIVKEAIMIEPTETESKESIDNFISIMKEAAKLTKENPELLQTSPFKRPVSRLDETKAAREVNIKWEM